MKKFKYSYKTPVSSSQGEIEAKNLTDAKKEINDYLKNDPILEGVKQKDIEVEVSEVKEDKK